MSAVKPVLVGLLFSILPVTAALAKTAAIPQMTVTGYATVQAQPDTAAVSAGVTTQAPSATEALAKDNARMAAIFATLAKRGIPKADIRTSQIALFPDYGQARSRQEQTLTYRASNTVTVTLPELRNVGTVIDALVKAGANRIDGVRFWVSNPAPFLAQAQNKAVRTAIRTAKTYARAAGVRLGAIQSILAGSAQQPQPLILRSMALAQSPISSGTQTIEASVTISWSLQKAD